MENVDIGIHEVTLFKGGDKLRKGIIFWVCQIGGLFFRGKKQSDERTYMDSKDMLLFLEKRKKELYKDSNSIIKKYDDYLAINGIYMTFDKETYRKKIKGRVELCDGIIDLYQEASYENEKIVLLEDLYAIGYNRDALTK